MYYIIRLLYYYDVMMTSSRDHSCKFILHQTINISFITKTKINIYFSAFEKSQKTAQLDDERSQEASDNDTIQGKQKDEDMKPKIKEQETSKKFTYCVLYYNYHCYDVLYRIVSC